MQIPTANGNGILLPPTGTSNIGIAAGDIVYMSTSGAWTKADADSSTTIQLMGLALDSTPHSTGVLIYGVYYDSGYTFNAGTPLYLSRTAGQLTNSLSGFTTGDYVKLIGWQLEDEAIFVNPDNTWIEIA